jgi:hypothetical protein
LRFQIHEEKRERGPEEVPEGPLTIARQFHWRVEGIKKEDILVP